MSTRRSSVRAKFLFAAAIAGSFNKVYAQPAAFLSIDINGGFIGAPAPNTFAGQNCTNLGWGSFGGDTSFGPHVVGGYTWLPWSGPGPGTIQPNGFANNQGGDDIQLPKTGEGGPTVGGSPSAAISKTYSGITSVASNQVTVAITSPGGPVNNTINARDRGVGGGTTNYADLYRDLIFVAKNNGNQLGGSPMAITVSGLDKNTTYTLTTFAYDQFNSAQYVFGQINTIPFDYAPSPEQVEGQGQFANPQYNLDGSLIGPRISAPANGLASATSAYQFASTFRITTDNNGGATIYEWANVTPGQGQTAAVLNGLQVGTVAASNWTAAGPTTDWGNGFTGGTPDADHAVANFGSIASAQTVTVEGGGRTVGVLNIASPTSYSFTGGTLTFNDSFGPDPNLPPPNGTAPSLVSSTTGHAQINVLGDSTFSATHVISSPVVLTQQTTINTAQANIGLRMTGNISGGSRGLNKQGTGALTLTGNNTYGGQTNVYAGRLTVNGTHTGGSDYMLIQGTTLGGTGTISLRDDIIPAGSGTAGVARAGRISAWNQSTIAPGDGGVGTLTIDRLAIGSPSPHGSNLINFAIEFGSGSADRLNVTDTNGVFFTNGGGTVLITASALAGATSGVFPILDYVGNIQDMTGANLPDISKFALASTSVGGFTLQLVNNTSNTSIDLSVTSGPPTPASWTGTVDSTWGVNGNWSNSISPNAIDALANFGTVASNRYAVTVDGTKTVGTVNFDSGTNPYTLSGGTLIFQATNGAPQLIVASGNQTIGSTIQMNNFLFVSAFAGSTVNITGPVLCTASGREISVSGTGTTQFVAVGQAPGLSCSTLLVNVGTTKFSAKGSNNSSTGTSVIGVITVAAGARLDTSNNSTIVDYTGGSPLTATRDQIKIGFNSASWTGGGITSSSAAATANTNNRTAIAYAEASSIGLTGGSLFGGVALPDATAVVMMYTLSGDANMDLNVNMLDFNNLSANFNKASGGVWIEGDFNYDGLVNGVDFNAIASNFGHALPGPLPGSVGAMLVPEPASLALLGAAGLLLRRRRPD